MSDHRLVTIDLKLRLTHPPRTTNSSSPKPIPVRNLDDAAGRQVYADAIAAACAHLPPSTDNAEREQALITDIFVPAAEAALGPPLHRTKHRYITAGPLAQPMRSTDSQARHLTTCWQYLRASPTRPPMQMPGGLHAGPTMSPSPTPSSLNIHTTRPRKCFRL